MERYSDSIEARFTGRHKKCVDLVGNAKGGKILNIGCYNGWFEQTMVKQGAKEVIGIDTEEKFIRMARRNVPGAKFMRMSALSLDFPKNYFDLVTMFDVIEHLPKNKEEIALKQARDVLKPNGRLIISTPNDHLLANLLDPAWYFGHRHYSIDKLKKILENSGFKIERAKYGGGIVELLSIIFLYILKIFGREIPFKGLSDRLREKEYSGENFQGYVTLFINNRLTGNEKQNKPLQIVISGNPFYGNYGTASMVISTIKGFRSIYPQARFYKGSIFKDLDVKKYQKIFSRRKLVVFGLNGQGVPIALSSPLLLFWSIGPYLYSDLVLDVPGEIPTDISFFSQLARCLLAKTLRKPFVIFGCSLGPFNNRMTQKIAKFFYNKVDLLMVRETVTRDYLYKLGVKRIKVTADTAFLMKAKQTEKVKKATRGLKPFIGMSIKGPYRKIRGYDNLVETLVGFITQELETNLLLVPHGEDDWQINKDVYLKLKAKNPKLYLLEGNFSPEELKAVISQSYFYIGSRIHSCIAAISSGVPTLILVPRSDHRGRGMMRFFGLGQMVIDPDISPEEAIIKLQDFLKGKKRIEDKIERNIKRVESYAHRNFALVKEFIEDNSKKGEK